MSFRALFNAFMPLLCPVMAIYWLKCHYRLLFPMAIYGVLNGLLWLIIARLASTAILPLYMKHI